MKLKQTIGRSLACWPVSFAVALLLSPVSRAALDGWSDIVWRCQSTGGANSIWLMNSGVYCTAATPAPPAEANLSWNIVGVSDLNDDGHQDLVWRNSTTGENRVWYMNEGAFLGSAAIQGVSDVNWKIVGIADFDEDGWPDLLWRNNGNGGNVIWYMEGADFESSTYIQGLPDSTWSIVATGDFNSDGYADIVWRTSNGANAVWHMNNATRLSTASLPDELILTREIVGASDFNNDGAVDLLWRDASQNHDRIWYMSGVTRLLDVPIANPQDSTWRIVGVGDFGTGAPPSDDYGNTIDTAASLSLNTSTGGAINYAADLDCFRVVFTSPGTITAYTTGATDTYGEWLNSNGTVLASDDDAQLPNFSITASVSPGTYYVRVRHRLSSGVGTYAVRVDFSGAPPPPSGLVARWNFDEGSGSTSADSSGNGHSASLLYGASWAAGRSGPYGLGLDGVDDYASVADASGLSLPGELTIAFWMKKNGEAGNWARLVGKGSYYIRNYGIFEEPGGTRLLFQQWNSGDNNTLQFYSTAGTTVGTWYHVIAVREGNVGRMYINGQLDSSGTALGPATVTSDPVLLGYLQGHSYFNGVLDDVRIYNFALNADEIAALYASAANTAPTIGYIPNQSMNWNSSLGVACTVWDAETPNNLTVTASSSNTDLLQDSSIAVTGTGANRTITLMPGQGRRGTTTVTVTVTDAGQVSASTSFVLTVNGPPTISFPTGTRQAAAAQSLQWNGTWTIAEFSDVIQAKVWDGETPAANLQVWATSSDQGILPNSSIVPGGSGADRTITVTPTVGTTGPVMVTVTVSDGSMQASQVVCVSVATRRLIITAGDPDWYVQQYFTQGQPAHQLTDGVEFYIANGEYTTRGIAVPNALGNTNASVIRFRGQSRAGVVLRLRSNYDTTPPDGGFYDTVLKTYETAGYFKRVEVEDMTLDGNFAAQGMAIQPVHILGYKVRGVGFFAKTAAVRRVSVRNWGSNGVVPNTSGSGSAGTESFGILAEIWDTGQTLFGTDEALLVVEDCEVSDVTTLHSGYYTGITIGTHPSDDARSAPHQAAIVQRCQIRGDGHGMGLGAVHTSWATFRSNVVINCNAVMNFDTGTESDINVHDNIFLDVVTGVQLGGTEAYSGQFQDFTFADNSFRLCGRVIGQMYQNYCYSSGVGWEDNLTLEMGRVQTNYTAALFVNGGTSGLSFDNNAVTTWPAAVFPPEDSDLKKYSVIRDDHATRGWMACDGGRNYGTADAFPSSLDGNCRSTVAWDFLPLEAPVSYLQATNEVPACARTDFRPAVGVGRVGLLGGSSFSVTEVAIETPTPSGSLTPSSFTVRARVVNQPTLVIPSGSQIHFQMISGPGASAGNTSTTGGSGYATCVYSGINPTLPGVYRIVAWVDGPNGTAGTFEANKDYYSIYEYAYGRTVGVVTREAPDVAVDKTGTLLKGHFRFHRTGDASATLTFSFSLPETDAAHPRAATPGSSGDYTLLATCVGSSDSASLVIDYGARTGSLTFPANVTALDLEVCPVSDDLGEKEGVWLQIQNVTDGAVQPGNAGACVAIYDRQVGAPSISPKGGTFTSPQPVTLQARSGATIRYTTNGTEPTISSTIYTPGGLVMTQSGVVKARAFLDGMVDSDTASATFTIQ